MQAGMSLAGSFAAGSGMWPQNGYPQQPGCGCGCGCGYQNCCQHYYGYPQNPTCTCQNGYPQQPNGTCQCWSPQPGAGYSAQEWDVFNMTPDGQNTYRWWADWIPTPEGQQWCANKRWEARRVVDGMIRQWGLQTLQAGEGVIDVGGDPGFVAAELLRSGIRVTVIDPAFGVSGKADPITAQFLNQFDEQHLRMIRQPFNQEFMDDKNHARLLLNASALVSLYPDEATNY